MDTSVTDNDAIVQTRGKIKKEKINEDIKEFAETAMNELLGWYGYSNPRDDPRSTKICQSHSGSNSSGPDSPKYSEGCGWCGKQVDENNGLSSGTSSFCSELCFSQSRRANFKKNKTCDWCRHVRHTVSYVDFQDGASQLQFCSDKCLNQYKMHIFCRETEAHLEIHPHLHGDDHSGAGLITPDLWLKNCKSPDSQASSPPCSPKPSENNVQTSPLPLITVTHPSKLMPQVNQENDVKRNRKVQKKHRKRTPIAIPSHRPSVNADMPQDLRIRHTPEKTFDASRFPKETAPDVHSFHPNDLRSQFFPFNNLFSPNPRLINPHFLNQPPPAKKFPIDLPPVTVLVPYPVVVPLPLPIPIPLPLSDFLPKEKTSKSKQTEENSLPSSLTVNGDKLEQEKDSSQKKFVVECDELADTAIELSESDEKNGITRPLRKRKKLAESKSRFLNKKKSISL